MYRQPASLTPETRRGVILLVVISLLTLFAIVGLSFVLYAEAEARSSQLFREAEVQSLPDVDPELLLGLFLGQFIYDVPDGEPDDPRGLFSALRGHSLARSKYGWNDAGGNTTPFNGTGRYHAPSAFDPFQVAPPHAKDDYYLINYTFFPSHGFLRDPERPGTRLGPSLSQRRPFVGGFNAPYTYPDLNNMFLAAVKADGTVLLPSYHRPWAGFGPLLDPINDPNNLRWRDPGQFWLNYMTLRPRPAEMGQGFPLPAEPTGDVKNLIGAPGGNDSIWIDLGAPVMVTPNGRKFKPLFAPLIIDLDNRINLNVYGNLRGQGLTHVSQQGWGPWEVNPGHVLAADIKLQNGSIIKEWTQLLAGSLVPTQPQVGRGRYGQDQLPNSKDRLADPGTLPHFYAKVNYDGTASAPFSLPGTNGVPGTTCFPIYPTGYDNGSILERTNHPLLYNLFQTKLNNADDRALPISNMEALLRYGDTGSPMLTSELFRFCPQNFGDPTSPVPSTEAARRRRLVTTHSFDVDQPGVAPWLWSTAPTASYDLIPPKQPYDPLLPDTRLYPTGNPVAPPSLPTAGGPLPPYPNSEFGPDWRNSNALLGRVDLNRPLPEYPQPGPNGQIVDMPRFFAAQSARQLLARDLFRRLRLATTGNAVEPLPAATTLTQSNALRWLAQLAINMVDFLDNDDYMTPFDWTGTAKEWVVGTELPRLVVNEAFVRRTPADALGVGSPELPKKHPDVFDVWVELHNPFRSDPSDPTLSDGGAARLVVRTPDGKAPLYGVYRVTLTRPNTQIRQLDNVLGNPDPGAVPVIMDRSNPTDTMTLATEEFLTVTPDRDLVGPSNGAVAGNHQTGYFVLGPQTAFPGTADPPSYQSKHMSYRGAPFAADFSGKPPTILLQRLACPGLPPNPLPGQPGYTDQLVPNPYVTVDYMEDVPAYDNNQAPENVASVGRAQPYAGDFSQRKLQVSMTVPKHTFFRVNQPLPEATAASPLPSFEWLVHLDRQLVSPMELLHVSAFKPHELTHQFKTGVPPAQLFKHTAPWFDQTARIYRVFEWLETRNRASGLEAVTLFPGKPIEVLKQVIPLQTTNGITSSGVAWQIRPGDVLVVSDSQGAALPYRPTEHVVVQAVTPVSITANFLLPHAATCRLELTTTGDRIPGKININTVWDVEIFRALCDQQASNYFKAKDVDDMFVNMVKVRNGGQDVPFSGNDKPFSGMAAGYSTPPGTQVPPDEGIQLTFLRALGANTGLNVPRLFDPPNQQNLLQTHPAVRYELLTKTYNHLTTRSNVFAVWLTVGFFEVVDDAARPVKLGAEIGRAENRHIRHRMFAIVDRSNLAIPVPVAALRQAVEPAAEPQSVALNAVNGAVTVPLPEPGQSWVWNIQMGSTLRVGTGANQEMVVVRAVNQSSPDGIPRILATFTQPHTVGEPVSIVGNPGPQQQFSPRANTAVVPYFSLIE